MQMRNKFGLIGSSIIGGILGASPFLGWVYFSKTTDETDNNWLTAKISELVFHYNSKTWQTGEYRPNRIILLRHGQTHGYSHTCDCQVAGLPVCALKPEVQRPLTNEGKVQSLQAGATLKKIIEGESVTFYSSPYLACKQTFAYVAGSFDNKDACMVFLTNLMVIFVVCRGSKVKKSRLWRLALEGGSRQK